MTEGPGGRVRRVTTARVERVERVTPHMIRIVLGGPGLSEFGAGQYSDHYIKIQFPVEGAERPSVRTYTIRRWDVESRELTVDFVYHGDEGIAGPWAASVQPGEEISFGGPGGGYTPGPDADWHLLAGDASALPAIAASVERLPAGAKARVFVEVDGPEEEQKLESAADVDVTWLHSGGAPVGEKLVRAVSALEFPAGDVHAFVHGEAGFVKELRGLLFVERGVPRDRVSISGYWRSGQNEDGWQAGKREWNRQVEAEQDAA